MEGGTSNSQSKHDDSQISPESSIAENATGFEQFVNEVIKKITEDCDHRRKSYLTAKLTELSSMHTVLENEHRLLNEKAIADERNVKETNEVLAKQICDLEKEVVRNKKITRLEDENNKLKLETQKRGSDVQEAESESSQENSGSDVECPLDWAKNYTQSLNSKIEIEKSKVVMLEKQTNELQLLVTDASSRAKSMEEELEAAETELLISKSTISQLKQDQSQVDQQLLNTLLKQIDTHSKSINDLQERIATAMSMQEDETTELYTKLDEYKCEMTQMAVMNRLKEDIWSIDVGKLKVQLTTKEKIFKDLIKRLNLLNSEKESISAQVNTLQQEKHSEDGLIQELETRLDSLQVAHAGVCSLIEDVEKVNNDLVLKMAVLKGKVAGSDKLFQKEQK